MEQIELKSKKVITLINSFPPKFIVYGNIILIIFLLCIIILTNFIKISNFIYCDLLVDNSNDSTKLIITSLPKFIPEKISKGTNVYILKNNDILFSGVLKFDINNMIKTEQIIKCYLPIEIPKQLIVNGQVPIELYKDTKLNAKIELNKQSLFNQLFK